MAYISTQQVAEIRNALKAAFPAKDGWKFSVRRDRSSRVSVNVLAGPVEFALYTVPGADPYDRAPAYTHPDRVLTPVTHAGVNQYHYEGRWSPESEAFIKTALGIIMKDWWDESDIQSDYFHTAFYFDLNIGDWNKPYEYKPLA